jgi:hypothetical protein
MSPSSIALVAGPKLLCGFFIITFVVAVYSALLSVRLSKSLGGAHAAWNTEVAVTALEHRHVASAVGGLLALNLEMLWNFSNSRLKS